MEWLKKIGRGLLGPIGTALLMFGCGMLAASILWVGLAYKQRVDNLLAWYEQIVIPQIVRQQSLQAAAQQQTPQPAPAGTPTQAPPVKNGK